MFVTALHRRNSHRILADGLLGRWNLDEGSGSTAYDSVGSEDGALVGAGASFTADGLDLNGSNCGCVMHNADWFSGNDNKFSISARLKVATTSTPFFIAIKYTDSSCSANGREMFFRVITGKLSALVSFGTSYWWRGVLGTATLSAGVEYYVGWSYDGAIDTNNGIDRFKFYINGVADATTLSHNDGSLAYVQNLSNARLGIGAKFKSNGTICGTNNASNGAIRDLRIYDRVLSADEFVAIAAGY